MIENNHDRNSVNTQQLTLIFSSILKYTSTKTTTTWNGIKSEKRLKTVENWRVLLQHNKL